MKRKKLLVLVVASIIALTLAQYHQALAYGIWDGTRPKYASGMVREMYWYGSDFTLLGHAAIGYSYATDPKGGVLDPILVLHAPGKDDVTGVGTWSEFLDGNTYLGHYRAKSTYSELERFYIVHYAIQGMGKEYSTVGWLDSYWDLYEIAGNDNEPHGFTVPTAFRCDGYLEWSTEVGLAKANGYTPTKYDGFYYTNFSYGYTPKWDVTDDYKDKCTIYYEDNDGDGYGSDNKWEICPGYSTSGYVTNSNDCDDSDPKEHPNQTWYKDGDGDRYSDGTTNTASCTRPSGYKVASELTATYGDCDDYRSSVHPGASEICDGRDNDCDGQVDEGVGNTYYRDADGDGYGNPSNSIKKCSQPSGYVTNSNDCDDSRSSVHPGASEICDGRDNDCDGQVDEGVGNTYYRDADGDGYGNPSNSIKKCSQPSGYVTNSNDCDDSRSSVHPGASEICDGRDNDCDGQVDEGAGNTYYRDADGDGYGNPNDSIKKCSQPYGYVTNSNDCDDSRSSVHPGASEICDGRDNDCDGQVDEGAGNTYYRDADGDGYGNPNDSIKKCSQPYGYVTNSNDCDDSRSSVHPGASEICDGRDNDCDGQVDEGAGNTYYRDADGDGYGNPNDSIKKCSQPYGYVTNSNDCDDSNPNEHPNQTWYKDADGDGYSDGATNTASCTRPSGYKVASELTATSGDCDDSDSSVIYCCDSNHLYSCTDETSCTAAGGNWCNGSCQSDPCPTTPIPASAQSFTYFATTWPVLSTDPSQTKPMGLGTVASGGGTLSITVNAYQLSDPVDIYFGLYSLEIDPDNIYLLTSSGALQKLSEGLAPWKANITGPINESLFGNIQTSSLPKGTYYLYLLVTPTGNLSNYYLWITNFVVKQLL